MNAGSVFGILLCTQFAMLAVEWCCSHTGLVFLSLWKLPHRHRGDACIILSPVTLTTKMKPHGVGITLGQPPLCPLPSTPGPSGVTEQHMADPLGPVYIQILCCLSDRFVLPWAVPSKQTATTMAGLSPDNRGQSFSEPKYCSFRGQC